MIFNIRDFEAKGDGLTMDTAAIQHAIDRCHVLGGGEVIVPAGTYLTGAIQLRANVCLRLEKDSVLLGSSNWSDYPITQVRWEGKWVQGHAALIYAMDADNIAIKGPGKIAGNHALGGRPSQERPFRHPALIEPINCKNLVFEDFSTDYYLMWSIHPTYCENLSFKNLTIRSTGGNGDGIDVDSCKHVRIENCDIATGDDCIALKSGRGMEAYLLDWATEDVDISNCTFSDCNFACIGIGTEASAGVRNVRIRHCKFVDTKSNAIYIKSRVGRGSFMEDIFVDDIDVSGMKMGAIRINLLSAGIQDAFPVPGEEGITSVKNFHFSNIRVKNVPYLFDGMSIHPTKPLDGLVIENVTGECGKGISLANVKNASIKNIHVTGFNGPLIKVRDVTGSGLEGATPIDGPKVPDLVPAPDKPYQLH